MSIELTLQNICGAEDTPSFEQFHLWIETALKEAPKQKAAKQVTLRLVNKTESAELNQAYREKPGPTNILSFPDDPIPGFEADSLGDLAVCVELVTEEAQAENKSIEAHWAHLVVHGVLHLLGYDHVQEGDAIEMEALEIKVLSTLGYDNPY